MTLDITVLPGDGIGPEVTREAVRVLRAVAALHGHDFHFQERPIGGVAIEQSGSPLPPQTLQDCMQSDAVLLGAVGGPSFDSLPRQERPEAGLLGLRRALGAFANLRPAVSFTAIADCSPLKAEVLSGADILIVRELVGGIYFGEPRGLEADGSAFNTMRYSQGEIERIARMAFELARTRRRQVTSVDKANVLETSQLWRKVVTALAREYPDVKLDHMYVDTCAMRLMTHPGTFDVILTENLFGDVLSDEAAAITGSIGVMASASIGGVAGLYEPVHGSAPDIAGKGLANPLGAILSAALLLRHTARLELEARVIEQAVSEVLQAGYRTADLCQGQRKGPVETSRMGEAVENAVISITEREHAYHAV